MTGSLEERFEAVQARMPDLYRRLQQDPHLPCMVVGVPSLSLDLDGLSLPDGLIHFEERMFYLLNLLRYPTRRLILLTSHMIPEEEVDYYLHFVPNVPFSHARARLKLQALCDRSLAPLSQKILNRPVLLERIRRELACVPDAYMTCYNSSRLEMQLAVELGIPILGTDPRHENFDTKTRSRALFRELGLSTPPGREGLPDLSSLARAIVEMVESGVATRERSRIVVKQDFSVSGLGNRTLNLISYWDLLVSSLPAEEKWARMESALRRHWGDADGTKFLDRMARLGGVVELWVEGEAASVQLSITQLGEVSLDATHEEMNDKKGEYLGCRLPYRGSLRQEMQNAALKVGEKLAAAGVRGRLDVDFLVRQNDFDAIDVNLRKGNTTNPLRTLTLLTGGKFDGESGTYKTRGGRTRCYFSTDKLSVRDGPPLLPQDVIDMFTYAGLHYTTSNHKGIVFHMLGSLASSGKLGVTCVGETPEEALEYFERCKTTLRELVPDPAWLS